jgi:hypothetical protein
MEQQRMRRLIGLEPGDFWEGSRYEGQEGCLRGMKLRVFDEPPPPQLAEAVTDLDAICQGQSAGTRRRMCQDGLRSLHLSAAAVAQTFLSEYQAIASDPSLLLSTHKDIPAFLRPDRLPVPKVAELSVPLPIVSLGSMARGAAEGMTTLCMGNVVWRELFAQGRWKARGWTQGNWEVERRRANNPANGELEGHAVIWLMPYRSLGEGKRVRFENRDYTFPVPKNDVSEI